ncbi:MAG: L-asparaginase [Ignavibacteria bacterium RIFOXYB2_FULL_35_12]|nr:MAG: L-asparaginase [Ignavibacteria bacterium GWA2_36_19]OGU53158.1 MAG: L-asparaginase [Ignavibacteria bacterium GWC2_35_8]OGU58972.1 MAG: L-asparaginase [Ignavibacteria bacterium GWF2_35_20]OGU77394.1 MAG: L-asparaginase [Ignavibacteria bacterium RBG_16_35_7]OGU80808.1 MAG: L-asparaginase [Ignavibacteria bacterium RIFOXYA2_FULL_35_9]OGU86131.1 MAG: L-asparaginase [Ignavibacteria bacterium RIFOXYA12_FULL_35_25]OGU92816.1 MAG: L-asparaginase [Ignavibacteria bacterium RIFOXYC12_FULL_35_11]
MKNILVVFTGGTFSMMLDEKTGGAVPRFSGKELLRKIPEAKKLAKITCYDFGKYPGPHMTPELMFKLSQTIKKIISKKKFDGVIVTHGTDTLEETAYLLDLTIKTEIPIVVIGSIKNSSEQDWDGPQNLIDAIYICLNQNCKNLGVLVCLNGEINAASEVTKIYTEQIDGFRSLDFGALGFVQNEKIILNRSPRKLETINTKKIITNVDLLTVYAGMDEKFFKYSADSKTKGLVVEALGVGNVPPAAFKGIKYVIEKNIPVVLVSRCPAGETLDIYGYPGAGKWLNKIGVIFADYLNGQKARIKLMLALGMTKDSEKLKKIFS